MKARFAWRALFILLMVVVLAACGGEPTATLAPPEEPTETPVPFLLVGEVTASSRTLQDTDASLLAYEKRAPGGDNFLNSLYERPFTSQDMAYQPDVNILTVSIAEDEHFFYFTLVLDGLDETANKLTGTYGIEFDRTKTGRGDLLVTAHDLSEEWLVDNVTVYVDTNGDMGGEKPVVAEAGLDYQGYEGTLEMEGDKVAYARLLPDGPAQVQIAVSHMLLENPQEFLWGGWADRAINDPLLFDYNDHFGLSEAGSPIRSSEDYPLAALYSLDNTCRLPYGFDQSGSYPGMCKLGVPVESCTLYCTGLLQGGYCYRGEWVCR